MSFDVEMPYATWYNEAHVCYFVWWFGSYTICTHFKQIFTLQKINIINIETSVLMLLPFLSVALHEKSTRNALLGPWPNNIAVYLTFLLKSHNCRKE
jgi:hypothetical protein